MQEIANLIIGCLLAFIIAVSVGILLKIYYIRIINPSYFRLNRKPLQEEKSKSNHRLLSSILIIIFEFIIIIFMKFANITTLSDSTLSIPVVLVSLGFIIFFSHFISLIDGTTGVSVSKNRQNTAFFSFIIIVIDIVIIGLQYTLHNPAGAIFNFGGLVEFQTTHVINVLDGELPALFLFINPFLYLSLFYAFGNIIRVENQNKRPLRTENTQNLLDKIINSIKIFIYGGLLTILLANGSFITKSPIYAFISQIALIMVVVIFISFHHRYEYRFAAQENLSNFRIKLITVLMILGVLYAIIVIDFDLITISTI